MWCIYTVECYLTVKVSEELMHLITWVNLENIKQKAHHKPACCMITFVKGSEWALVIQ